MIAGVPMQFDDDDLPESLPPRSRFSRPPLPEGVMDQLQRLSIPPGAGAPVIKYAEHKRGDTVAGVRLVAAISDGARLSCWRGLTKVGNKEATVITLSSRASVSEQAHFFEASNRWLDLAKKSPIEGLLLPTSFLPPDVVVSNNPSVGHLRMAPKRRWSLNNRLDSFYRIAQTMAELHSLGVVHGCLRPDNLLLDDSRRPLVSDIGLVDVFDSFEGDVRNVHGYGAYAAPEVRDGEPVATTSDIFSLGRLLYFLLLGEDPSEPDDEVPRLQSILDQPAAFVRIVRLATVRDPLNRYQRVEELLADLDDHASIDDVGLDHPEVEETNLAPLDWTSPTRAAKTAPKPRQPAGPPTTRRVIGPAKRDPRRPQRAVGSRTAAPKPIHAEAKPEPEAQPHTAPARPQRRREALAEPPASTTAADPLTRRQQVTAGVAGSGILVVLLAIAFFTGWDGSVVYGGSLISAVGMSMLVHTYGYEFVKYRLLVALAFAAAAAVVNPVGLLARAGRGFRMNSGSPAARAAAVRQMRKAREVEITDADLHDTDLSGMNLNLVSFDRSNLKGARFVGAQLANATVRGADVTGADFTAARLSDVDMSAAIGFSEAICSVDTIMPHSWECVDGKPSR
jgi:hypothetical protein